jgi:hypothetical protein
MRKRPANPAAQTKAVNQKLTVSIPKTGEPSTAASEVKSLIRNILLASPAFPRLYADAVISSAPNSNEAKILAHNYQKIIDRTNIDRTNRTNMPVLPSVKVCTHIKVTGVRCGSPALRREQFCYFHQRMMRGVATPPNARLHPIALIENEEAIQASLMEVINALARNTIDLKRAELILRALNTAVRNARRVHFGLHSSDMVKQVPEYAASTGAETASAATAHVRKAAPGFSGGPEVRCGAGAPKPAPTPPTKVIERKPPLSVKEAEAPKERKIAAHSLP